MKPIALNINDEYKIKIENGNEFKGSIFEEVYYNAAINLSEIINQSKNGNEYDSYNNIIAFTGERGRGKSSSMISFKNALLNHSDKNKHSQFFESKQFDVIRENNFEEIDTVDPSLFRGNESLFEIIVAKMFSKFQKLIKKENNISDEQRREIIKLFQQVFDNLKIINSDKKEIYNLDSLEALSNLAYSSKLRSCFGELVDKFLNLTEERKSFLIIAIDDFDLNISKAYEMLEDIRHFLIQKRIILLVACKIEQLKESIINEIVKEYRYKLQFEQKNKIHNLTSIDERKNTRFDNRKISNDIEIVNEFILIEISTKAEKYIEKLIPFDRQIFIPSLTEFCDISFSTFQDENDVHFDFFESNLNIENTVKPSLIYVGEIDSLENTELDDILEGKNEKLREKLIIEKKLFIEKNIYDCLLKLIYEKSNVFINKTDYRYHSIFPPTLRELKELIKVFNNDNALGNFRKYILNKSAIELPENLKNIIVEIDKQDFSFLNSHIINHLGNIRKTFEETNGQVLDIEFDGLNPSFCSVGDVFSKFKVLYKNIKSTNVYWYKFLDYLNVYYSIRINQILEEKPGVLLEYCKGGLYNHDYKIFPDARITFNERLKDQSRDWIEYKMERKPGESITAIFKSLEDIDAYWLAFFIQYFGIPDSVKEYNSPYFRKINQGGGAIYNLTFNPFAIFTNILFPIEVWHSIFNKDFDIENIIMQDILYWKKVNMRFQLILTNPMFFNELTDELSRFSTNAFKGGVPNYFDTLYFYFSDSIKKGIRSINDKYAYLNIDENCFNDHPIMIHWRRIKTNENTTKIMSEIFEAFIKNQNIEKYEIVNQYSKEEMEFIKTKFNYYNKRYLTDKSKTSLISLTNLMNSFDRDSQIFKDLFKIRYSSRISISNKKIETYNYLKKIIDGQST